MADSRWFQFLHRGILSKNRKVTRGGQLAQLLHLVFHCLAAIIG
jgi:hypothetical protein